MERGAARRACRRSQLESLNEWPALTRSQSGISGQGTTLRCVPRPFRIQGFGIFSYRPCPTGPFHGYSLWLRLCQIKIACEAETLSCRGRCKIFSCRSVGSRRHSIVKSLVSRLSQRRNDKIEDFTERSDQEKVTFP